jgi:hypothetical protein
MSPQEKSYMALSGALRQVLARPQLAMELKSSETRAQAVEKLKIDDDMAREILNILMDLETRQTSEIPNATATVPHGNHGMETDREFLFESFHQLRTAYHTSLAMSVVMFTVGVAFLVIAAVRSFIDPQSVVMTSVIGGIGIVQIVALFYRNPLADIARTVSNAQQAKMAVMSYLLGITLLNQQIIAGGPTDAHMKSLVNLTEKALKQLHIYTEAGDSKTQKSKGISTDAQDAKPNEE